MSSPSPNETNEQKSTEDANNEDHTQRKRCRVGSHIDEESNHTLNHEKPDENSTESASSIVENPETSENNSASTAIGPTKRRKISIDIRIPDEKEKANDSTQNATVSSTNDESKGESTTTDDDDEEEEDDDDDDDDDGGVDSDKEIEDEEEDDNDANEEIILPRTTNIYSRLRQRELGIYNRPRDRATIGAFHNNMIASRHLVQRMQVSHTLDGHDGCVNALSFNRTGTLLASGSDDLKVIIWNWDLNQIAVAYDSEHHSNVFQAKFIPFSEDRKIVSCARDGQIRLAELHPDGTIHNTKKIAQHLASAHKLSIDTITGTDIFSCGEDSVVFQIDLRENKANKLLTVAGESISKLPLYSIELNRCNQNEFVVAGMDPYIRVFDRRYIDSMNAKPLKSFCPDLIKKIEERQRQPSVTCAVYNYNGTEILGSYNDEDIYLFDATHSDGADAIHHYCGHRNNNTVKGVNFYGRNSEYVISGSDCGNIFIWDKQTEKCIWFEKGDDDGTVNVLEPHPHFPIIATSGLEHDIKIWQPLNDKSVDFKRLKTQMKRNAREREHELHFASVLDSDTGGLLRLMRPVFRQMARQRGDGEVSDDDDDDDDDDDNDEGDSRRARHIYSFNCAPS